MAIVWLYHHAYDYGSCLPLRQVHGFVLDKATRIQRLLLRDHAVASSMQAPLPVDPDDLSRVHSKRVVNALRSSRSVARAVEFPVLAMLPRALVRAAIVTPQLHAAGGTSEGLRRAFAGDCAFNLSGGFHHARPDLSHGFCLINDLAVAIARLRHEGTMLRALVVDLDLHQGDGNAVAFANDPDVFTVSMHEAGSFPIPKMRSDLDVELPPGCDDPDYLNALRQTLDEIPTSFQPDVLVYLAGTDVYRGDPLGGLQLTRHGIIERDRIVARFARSRGCGLLVLPAGGYSPASPGLSAAGFASIRDVWQAHEES